MTEVDIKSETVMEVCMICKHGLVDAQDIHEARTSFSKTLLAVKLGKIIQSSFRKDEEGVTYQICSGCAELVNEIDQCEIKLMALENEVKLKYKMPFPIEVHSRSSQEGAPPPAPPPPPPDPLLEGGELAPAQICQVLDAAGVDTGETYSIEVVDSADGLPKGSHVAFSDSLGESIILYEQQEEGFTGQQLVELDHMPYSVQLSDDIQTSEVTTIIERKPRKRLKRRRWGAEGGYFCDECDATFSSFPELQSHRQTHDSAETFNCRYCKHIARTKIKLHRHMQENHKDRMIPCPYCEKRFPEKCNLTRHVAIHLEPKFICEICSRPFHSKGDLGKHMVFRHTTEKNHPCPECDASFKTSWMMKRHLSRVHARL
ncbi:zinc finger protein 84-like [Pollicipes pollicipes]|uniref:zinc finger protein 84-like n=1 Tax=Pollicipes pollicipes TaxID=41117 RepID=UPI0018853781|nr:zinc finger protein 84-like [Pollicipes pollicipes]XP_037081867.1 zinc finger protein 84-like [Pollicipes pollicipes]XP_037081876.1 zinc finger protein 84-like [Pollicipes pollicipes]XP_037081884.1 zinc finger protein 84-like [Pollicipes pollicipes]XP_037081893.1 zinc finger protein 84-like [Pollicipes pollicipes]XP_037091438.1 zinc finger protein 84-like [Pollicipes pollicipes]XP_037091445.1 zinc finger protein 84-like [Pollicipes pollicipes]XP_037091454.1 zinc finger protein 84-like [Po